MRARPRSSRCESRGSSFTARCFSDRAGCDLIARALLRGQDEVTDVLLAALAKQLHRIGVAVDDRLEEDLAILVGGQRALGPAAHLVEQLREPRVGLAVLLRDLALDALRERGARAGRGDRDRE